MEITETMVPSQKSSTFTDADVVYHYKGVAYPLTYEEGSMEDFVEDEHYLAVYNILNQGVEKVIFTFSDKPTHFLYLFDNQMEAYDFEERNGHPMIGRQFKVSHSLDVLRDNLIEKYGYPLDLNNSHLRQEMREGIIDIYEKFQITSPLPENMQGFIGHLGGSLSKSNARNNPVLTVWEHANFNGESMTVEQAATTLTWTYGTHGCYTMATNEDLSLEFKSDGTNWNDCISSKCLSFIQGADAMGESFYKDHHFSRYGCAYVEQHTYATNQNAFPGTCWNMSSQLWGGGPFCGHMNDQITSIRIKAIWQNCPITFDNL